MQATFQIALIYYVYYTEVYRILTLQIAGYWNTVCLYSPQLLCVSEWTIHIVHAWSSFQHFSLSDEWNKRCTSKRSVTVCYIVHSCKTSQKFGSLQIGTTGAWENSKPPCPSEISSKTSGNYTLLVTYHTRKSFIQRHRYILLLHNVTYIQGSVEIETLFAPAWQ